ncbi:hypothetical protein DZ860_19685 [Vibrio sinensis]|uniref:Uncharacterized protein n=1 Tax=Vibrio sinensis TaxID=2302434 RepID=A0A3A6QEL8_9VIBR|nr:hypothetical protein DZ860_19685 [Vibrio sinensis]
MEKDELNPFVLKIAQQLTFIIWKIDYISTNSFYSANLFIGMYTYQYPCLFIWIGVRQKEPDSSNGEQLIFKQAISSAMDMPDS